MLARDDHTSPIGLVLAAGAAAVALGAALAMGWEPGIPGEWVWEQNRLPVHLAPTAVAALLLVLMVAVLCRPGRWVSMRPIWRAISLAALVLVVLALQWSLLTAVGPPSVSWVAPGWIIASPNATTYFSASHDVRDVRDWVASYPQHMSKLPYHARTHPPGFVLLFLFLRRASAGINSQPGPTIEAIADGYNREFGLLLGPADAAAAIGGALVIALAGALSLVPLYFLGREFVGAEGAICGVALAAAMPGILLLGASPDQIVLLLAITCLWLFYSGWRRGGLARAFLAGVAAAAGLFFTLGFAAVMAWLIVWALLGALGSENGGAAARRALVGAGAALAGFLLVHSALYLIWGYRPLAVAQQAFLAHRNVTMAEFPRTYWKWVLMNPAETAMFVGLPLVAAALWAARSLLRDANWARLRSFLLAWLIVLALLDISGAVRGEVGRIWLFLFWPAALAAGAWLAARPERGRVALVLAAVQVAQVLLMRGYLTIYSIL